MNSIAPPPGSPGTSFGLDILVNDHSEVDGLMDITTSSSGEYYLVVQSMNAGALNVYRSSDGGRSWWSFVWAHHPNGLLNPSISVEEEDDDALYITYTLDDRVRLWKIYIHNAVSTFSSIYDSPGGLSVFCPRIITDNREYSDYWLYASFTAEVLGIGSSYAEVYVYRSKDEGITWERILDVGPDRLPAELDTHSDLAFGGSTLYVVSDEKDPWTSERNILLRRSLDFGDTWQPIVNLTDSITVACYAPKVAAIQLGNQVIVAYTADTSSSNQDVRYAWSTNYGASWNRHYSLASSSVSDELGADLAVDPSGGNFHAVYWKENDIVYRSAPAGSPTSWSTPITVNDTNQASHTYVSPVVTVDWLSVCAGIAWPDFRVPTYAAYFDRMGLLRLEVTDLIGGALGTATTTGAAPLQDVYVYYTLSGPGSTFIPVLGFAVDLDSALLAGPPVTADSSGQASFSGVVPAALASRTIWIQSATTDGVSNVVEEYVN